MLDTFTCPIEIEEKEIITLAHGSGGRLTSQLIEEIFVPAFSNEKHSPLHDGAFLEINNPKIAFTTDSFVVQPIFFPGGDIGKLAVTGTINDLAMCCAKPKYLSCSFIIEEGFFLNDLKKIVNSMQKEAKLNGVEIVTGDTKVIERSSGSNIFINTSGIGINLSAQPVNPLAICSGDVILLSGDIGRHGMAIMAKREGLTFSSPLSSDCASLFPAVNALLEEGIKMHCLRDLTRGGLATALIELAESTKKHFFLNEEAISVMGDVNSACEILGIDPLYVANEGRFVVFVPREQANKALLVLKQFQEGEFANIIGEVGGHSLSAKVRLKHSFGSERYLYRLSGEQLPRIC